ncbi:protein kinase subdomain-containing protein PKL/CAK/Fmp29 [Heliocybe sulcata]|uniref:Protein kinase subdomain-containing protein PKL/CAK/Fmp29 n=1 Tax=Heliocybe sulcata TaxID=5364 RepID=A0A5C3MNP4_9AGAM|nr:protein kinase subdomain-containing protein PKL/CAK/Fmp29 [Heliocybe sulcata]
MANPHTDLFDYTSGRWMYNDALRHAERRLVFDVEELRRLAAQSVGLSPADVVDLSKLAEGRFNRTFLITSRDNFQMVARIPYPATVPKYYAVASKWPQWSSSVDLGCLFLRCTKLSDVWLELGKSDIISILRRLVQLESQMMTVPFPAGGSLYYTRDLEKATGTAAIPLKDGCFCVGPATRLPMWFGRRSQLDVDRGPYESAEAALVTPARKELAYLEKFGRPLLPFRRERREGYQYQEQSPSAHIENLKRYLLIAPSLVPEDSALGHFCIRHPDLQPSNIVVRRSSDSGWQVVSLLDWQHASILPLFLLARVPQRIQNHDDPVSQYMTPPSLPENFDELGETDTEECNKPHYAALSDHMCVLRSRLFNHASDPWEGETFELKVALIRATERWETLTGGSAPCPLVFDAGDVRETMELNEAQRKADETFHMCQNLLGLAPEGWMPIEESEAKVALCKQMKEIAVIEAMPEEERVELMGHWPWDDMDEGKHM